MSKVKFDLVGFIIEYESGEISTEYLLQGFSELIKSGQAWSLQGHYGRVAKQLIDNNLIDNNGIINWDKVNELD